MFSYLNFSYSYKVVLNLFHEIKIINKDISRFSSYEFLQRHFLKHHMEGLWRQSCVGLPLGLKVVDLRASDKQ